VENPPEPPPDQDEQADPPPPDEHMLEDLLLAAATAAMPRGLLAQLQSAENRARRSQGGGRAGALQKEAKRGRPAGIRAGDTRRGDRLNIIETLRAAAPWQRLRRRESADGTRATRRPRVDVRAQDFRVTRYKQKSETATIFVVDASGSSALNRLAEAKGAVELLLADCYVRRDRVALISFRGRSAELLLPPTRSLVRAKRSLGGLPGGGGTPLAAGIDAAASLADAVRRHGETPSIVFLTDGKANIGRAGTPGREAAEADALSAARALRAAGVATLLVDTSPRTQPQAQNLAREMNATYLALPYADAHGLSAAVRAALPAPAV
jgi:magnesium chelatase subunit D